MDKIKWSHLLVTPLSNPLPDPAVFAYLAQSLPPLYYNSVPKVMVKGTLRSTEEYEISHDLEGRFPGNYFSHPLTESQGKLKRYAETAASGNGDFTFLDIKGNPL